MDQLRALKALVLSVELGSLSGAARALQTTQPSVSKGVAALERSLGARLLRRGSAHLSPTEEGQRFYERAKRLLEDYEEAVGELQAGVERPRGRLRLSAPLALGQTVLNGLMLEFLARYPEIELDLLLDDRFVDPLEERIDLALRLSDGARLPADLVARAVGRWPRLLVAAPAYLAARGAPKRPQDLLQHDYLRYAAGEDGLLLQGPGGAAVAVPVRSRYRVNSAVALRDAVLAGAGIALQPSWMVAQALGSGALRRVLPRHTGPAQLGHLLYAPRRQLPLRVRVLVDFLAERLAALPGAAD